MRVIYLRNDEPDLIKGQNYEVISKTKQCYLLKNEDGIEKKYWRDDFKILREKIMKIEEWSDLIGVELPNGYKIISTLFGLEMERSMGRNLYFEDHYFSKETIMEILKAMGLEVQFIK